MIIKMINKLISRIKGEDFSVDDNIPIGYVIRFLCLRTISLIWGVIRLRRFKRVYIHPSSNIICPSLIKCGKNFSVGKYCYVDALSKKGLICGNNVSMGFHTHIALTGSFRYLGEGMIIGNNVGLGSHGHYGSGKGLLKIGDDTIFGNYVSVHPENHVFNDLNIPIRCQGVHSNGGVEIGSNCWIGAKVTILDGTKIGDGCIVAAGAVVKGCFPDNVIIGGVPAKIIKHR